MVMLANQVETGAGIYSIPEAAVYARMSRITLSRWFRGNTSGKRVFDTLEDGDKVVNFWDFIQALAVRNLRLNYRISLQKIREAVERAENDYQVEYPFARQHSSYLFEGQIWVKLPGPSIVQISGREHGQSAITPVIERFLVNVSFDPQTGLASEFKAFESNSGRILMNPKFRFGEPILQGCGYTPAALFEAAKTEGSADAAAKIYGVTEEQVEVCIDYFDYLQAA
jgi:uncharacterized protein (DUF433 family)